jgi:hypothetical protein
LGNFVNCGYARGFLWFHDHGVELPVINQRPWTEAELACPAILSWMRCSTWRQALAGGCRVKREMIRRWCKGGPLVVTVGFDPRRDGGGFVELCEATSDPRQVRGFG